MKEGTSYRPLPKELIIGMSGIEGLGLFCIATRLVPGTSLGISHVDTEDTENFFLGKIRTPLGGFVNHSEDPNCELFVEGKYTYLMVKELITEGEELTLDYRKSKGGLQYVKNFNE